MSLETEIKNLHDAIRDLIKALETSDVRSAPAAVAAPKVEFNDKLEPQPIVQTIDYTEDIQRPALALVQAKGRYALAKVLAEFNAKTGKDVPPDQWPAFMAAIAEASK